MPTSTAPTETLPTPLELAVTGFAFAYQVGAQMQNAALRDCLAVQSKMFSGWMLLFGLYTPRKLEPGAPGYYFALARLKR